jgi:hypothetical protein
LLTADKNTAKSSDPERSTEPACLPGSCTVSAASVACGLLFIIGKNNQSSLYTGGDHASLGSNQKKQRSSE